MAVEWNILLFWLHLLVMNVKCIFLFFSGRSWLWKLAWPRLEYRLVSCLIIICSIAFTCNFVMHKTIYKTQRQGCKHSGRQLTRAVKFCTLVANILGSSVRKLLHVTLLAPIILSWLLQFRKICGTLPYTAYFTETQNFRMICTNYLLLPLHRFLDWCRCPCGLRSVSAAARLLGSRVRITSRAWISVT
jgi:hypothetical protein